MKRRSQLKPRSTLKSDLSRYRKKQIEKRGNSIGAMIIRAGWRNR